MKIYPLKRSEVKIVPNKDARSKWISA